MGTVVRRNAPNGEVPRPLRSLRVFVENFPSSQTSIAGVWGSAPPRKPNFQASKLPNFHSFLLFYGHAAGEPRVDCALRKQVVSLELGTLQNQATCLARCAGIGAPPSHVSGSGTFQGLSEVRERMRAFFVASAQGAKEARPWA